MGAPAPPDGQTTPTSSLGRQQLVGSESTARCGAVRCGTPLRGPRAGLPISAHVSLLVMTSRPSRPMSAYLRYGRSFMMMVTMPTLGR